MNSAPNSRVVPLDVQLVVTEAPLSMGGFEAEWLLVGIPCVDSVSSSYGLD